MGLLHKVNLIWKHRNNLGPIMRSSKPSFSQYGEDVLLEKLLRPSSRGTYVDVGANHPIEGSNTFRLYLRGWTGLAIEPNPRFSADYRRSRPRDRHLTEGAAISSATLTYYSFERDVFNTFDPDIADKCMKEGEKLLGRTQVGCRPLAEIVDQHLDGRHIDLLNVDCEGLDIDVLDSLDLTKRRPTAIIVEDYQRYMTFQQDMPAMRLERFLRDRNYLPLAQTAWSGLYVATDWRDLFRLSDAYDERRVQNGYLPGQASLSEAGQ